MYRDAFQFAHLELQINITFIFEMSHLQWIVLMEIMVTNVLGLYYIQVCTVDKKVYIPLLKWQVSDFKEIRPRQIISERFPPLKG